MRKIYLALAIAGGLAGCAANSDKAPVKYYAGTGYGQSG